MKRKPVKPKKKLPSGHIPGQLSNSKIRELTADAKEKQRITRLATAIMGAEAARAFLVKEGIT